MLTGVANHRAFALCLCHGYWCRQPMDQAISMPAFGAANILVFSLVFAGLGRHLVGTMVLLSGEASM